MYKDKKAVVCNHTVMMLFPSFPIKIMKKHHSFPQAQKKINVQMQKTMYLKEIIY